MEKQQLIDIQKIQIERLYQDENSNSERKFMTQNNP